MFNVLRKLNYYESEINAFEGRSVEEGKILFYGSSQFARWSEKYSNVSLEDAFDHKAINHGFGGSTVEEALYYYPRAVRPWKPRVLVFSSFLNDPYYGYSEYEIMFLLERLLEYARTDMPGIHIVVCDVHPMLKHMDEKEGHFVNYRERMNSLLKEYCDKHDDCTLVHYVDYPGFFENDDDTGNYYKVKKDIFVEDRVHMNSEGYSIYYDLFSKVLKEYL